MDWVHCNTCFVLPTDSKVLLHITTCGHLFCTNCLKKVCEKKCPMCGQNVANTIPLSKDMKPDVQLYFQDPSELCSKAIKQYKLGQQVAEFQKGHSKRLQNHQKRQLTKAGEMMKQAKELDRKYRHVSKEADALKHFVGSLGYKPNDIIQKIVPFPMTPGQSPLKTPRTMMCETPTLSSNNNTPSAVQIHQQNFPGSSPMQMQFQANQTSPGPVRMSPSPNRSNYPPSASQMALNRGKTGKSPHEIKGPSPTVSANRLTIRTPPSNGKIGPVRTSPKYTSPRGHSGQAQSKIGKILSASRSSIPAAANNSHHSQNRSSNNHNNSANNSNLKTPILQGRRPISVGVKR